MRRDGCSRRSRWRRCSLLLAGGCASNSATADRSGWTGPAAASPVTTDEVGVQQVRPASSSRPRTTRSTRRSTDEDVLERLPQVLEGAYAQYQNFAVTTPSSKPMKCYVFGKRGEWAEFTWRNTGNDAAIYLQITRGGYCIGDWFVSYYVGDHATFSVAAPRRLASVRRAPLQGPAAAVPRRGDGLHVRVGQVPAATCRAGTCRSTRTARTGCATRSKATSSGRWRSWSACTPATSCSCPGDKIEAFYAQNWAFARFLWEYENGAYRPAFKKLLADTAAGNVYDPTGTLHRAQALGAAERQADARALPRQAARRDREGVPVFIADIAYKQFGRQWMSRP